MHQLSAICAVSAFLMAGAAIAEEATAIDEQSAAGANEGRSHLLDGAGRRGRSIDLSLALQLDSTMSGDLHRNYYDAGMTGRLRATMFDRLTIELALGIIHHDIELFRPDGSALDAVLEVPWRGTIGGTARLVLYRWPFLDISLFAEIYFPIGGGEATLVSADFYDDLTLLGLMNIDDIRNWVTVRHRWYRAELGVTVRGLIGRWRPFIDIKYVHLPGSIELELDPDLDSFVDLLAPDMGRSFDASFMYPYYAIGFEVELGYGVELEIRVAATPTPGSGWAFVGRAVLEIPLTAQPRCNWSPPPRRRARRRGG